MSRVRRISPNDSGGYFDDVRIEGELDGSTYRSLKQGRLKIVSPADLVGERDPGYLPDVPGGRGKVKFERCPGCGGMVTMPCVLCTLNRSPHVTRITKPRRQNAKA